MRSIELADPRLVSESLELGMRTCVVRIDGTVSDAVGAPIEDATISLDGLRIGRSDARGAYTVCVPFGDVDLEYTPDGYGAILLGFHVIDSTTEDVVLVPAAAVTGRVVRASDDAAVADAFVQINPQDWGRDRAASRTAITDATGTFRIEGVTPGLHRAFAFADGVNSEGATSSRPRSARRARGSSGSSIARSSAASGTNAPGAHAGRRKLRPGRRAGRRARVLRRAPRGDEADAHGKPVKGVFVRWIHVTTQDEGRGVTDATGRYRCRAMQGGGTYRAKVFASPTAERPFSPAPGTSYPTIDVKDGTSKVEGATIAIDHRTQTIGGVVVDATGAPIADALVKSVASESLTPWFNPWRRLPMSATDADGGFVIAGLAAGTYAVQARATDGGEAIATRIASGASGVRLVLVRPGDIVGQLAGYARPPAVYATAWTRVTPRWSKSVPVRPRP